MSKKEALLIQLAAAHQPLELLDKSYRKIKRIRKQIRKDMYKREKVKNFIIAVLCPFLLLAIFLAILMLVFNGVSTTGIVNHLLNVHEAVMLIIRFEAPFISLITLGFGGLIFCLCFMILNNQIRKSRLLAKAKNVSVFADQWREISELEAEITCLKVESWYVENVEFLHEHYRRLSTVEQLYMIVDEGRATNLSDAINCFKADCHREKMERYQSRILSETQRAAMIAAAMNYYATYSLINHSRFDND